MRQAQRLGCSGTHTDANGFLKPCSSSIELARLTGQKPGSSERQMRGRNKLRRQWENLGENGIVSIDTLGGGGLVSGMTVKADLMYQPRDNDPDVFTDIESARLRSRQLGCIGVSRRISKTGKTVWMPCTNMSDFNRLTGTTSLGRRHQRESIRKIIRDEIRQVNRRQRKKTLHEELNTHDELNTIETKVLGERLSTRTRPTQIFQDITGVLDGDGDGIVFDTDIKKRRPIIPIGVVGSNGEVIPLTPAQQSRAYRQVPRSIKEPRETLTSRRSRTLAKMKSSARLNISEPGTYFSNKTPSEIIELAVPTNPQELMAAIAENPYSQINAETLFRAIMSAKPNWKAASLLRQELLSEFGNESRQNGIKHLIRKFGFPVSLPTENIPQKPMFKTGKWGLISGMYDSRGFIGINKDAILGSGNRVYQEMTRARKMSIVRHELGHAFSDMAAAMSPDLVDRRLRFFADDMAREMRRLSRAGRRERRYRKTYMDDLVGTLWGTRDEFDSARKISDYATFSRDEYFAETIDALFDPQTSFGKNRVDNRALAHAAETLGISISEMMELSGREREIPNLFDIIDSRATPVRGSKSTTRPNKQDQKLVDLVAANPSLFEETPIQLFGQFSPETLNAARLERENAARIFGITGPEAEKLPGSGGRKIIDEMLEGIDDNKKQLKEPTAYFVMGPSGSGKSTAIKSGILDVPSSDLSMHIGIDEIKTRMTGYNDGIGSSTIHASARYVQRKAATAGINESVDIVVDDYGNSGEILRSAAANNYTIVGNMLFVPEKELERRIREREEQTGPVLGADFARLTNRNYINNIKQQIMSGLFSKVNIWDNSTRGGPKMIAGHDSNGLFKVRNPKKFRSIFGSESDAVEEILLTSALTKPFKKKTPTASVFKSFDNKQYFRMRGFGGQTKLTRDSLSDINTVGIDMSGQDLSDDADLGNLDMSFSNLDSISGIATNISGSSLIGSSMKKAYLPAMKTLSPAGKPPTDMRFTDMSHGNFMGSDFSGSDMTGATLFGANLRGSNFTNTNLLMANLDNADLRGANLQGARVSVSQLINSIMDETTTLPGTIRPNTENIRSYGKNSRSVLPSPIDVGADNEVFGGLIVEGRLAISNGNFDGISAQKRNLIKSSIINSEFVNSDLDGAHLMSSDISDSSFVDSSMARVDLSNSTLSSVSFASSDMRFAILDGVNATGPVNMENSIARRASFRNINNGQMFILASADLRNSDFSGTDLSGAITSDETNLDGAIFSSRKHLPEEFTGTPSIRLPAKSDDPLSAFQGISLGELADFFESVTSRPIYSYTYRGLTSSDWLEKLRLADEQRIDLSEEISRWSKKYSALRQEIEQLRSFPLPDGSVVDLFSFTEQNSPDGLIDLIVDKAKTSPGIFENANPSKLWQRAMSIRSIANYMDIDRDDLAARNQLLTSISNTQKLIDAMFVNQRFMPSDNDRDAANTLRRVEINEDEQSNNNNVAIGSKSTTSRIKQTTLSPEDMRLAASDLETYLLRFINQAEVGWAPGNTQVPLVRMPRVPILMDALGLSPDEIAAIETVAYPSKADRINIARAVVDLLSANEYRIFGTKFVYDGQPIRLPSMIDEPSIKMRFDDSDIIDYMGIDFSRFRGDSLLFGEGVELQASNGQAILKFKADLTPDFGLRMSASLIFRDLSNNFYGSSADDKGKFDVLSVMMKQWSDILDNNFARLNTDAVLRDKSILDASTADLIRRGTILDINDFIDFADNEIGQWYATQMKKISDAHAAKLRVLARSLEARDLLRTSVGVTPSMTYEDVSSTRENLYGVMRELYPDSNDIKIQEITDFMMQHIAFALVDDPESFLSFRDAIEDPDVFLHEMGHLVLGLGSDRHGDFASNYAAFLSLGGDGSAHTFLNSFNSIQSRLVPEWSIDEPYEAESRVPGNVMKPSERETLPIIRVPLWAELPDATWGLPDGRSGSKSSIGPKPGMPESWNNLPENIRTQFERLLGQSNNEELTQELKDSVSEDRNGFSFIRHKFVHGLYFPGQDASFNQQLRRKQEAANTARANKDWDSFVFLHERPYRLEAFVEIMDDMSDDEFWSVLSDVWTDSENIPEMRELWDEVLASPRPNRLSMMNDDERIEYDSLPEVITIYQGHTEDRDDGWSWTIDPSIAQWFAGRFANLEDSPGYVTTAKVNKSDIHAFLTRRGESEILTDPETVNITSIESLNDFSGGSKSSTAQPPIPQMELEEVALLNKLLPEASRNSPGFTRDMVFVEPELKALLLRLVQQMELTESIKHPHVPLISYAHIKELTDQIGITGEDIRLLRGIEYLSPDERNSINEFVRQRRQEMDQVINGWSYDIYRDSDGDNVISFFDRNGDFIFSYRGGADLATWNLEPDYIDVADDGLEGTNERAPYQGLTIPLDVQSRPGVFTSPYEDDSLTLLMISFMEAYNRARFSDWEEQLVDGTLDRDESRSYLASLFTKTIDEAFDFGESESAQIAREQLTKAKKAIDDSFSHLESFVSKFTSYLNKRDAVNVSDEALDQLREEQSRDAVLADVLFFASDNYRAIPQIALDILPELVRVISAPNIKHISDQLDPNQLPGSWEHEVGHIVVGLGATRHGDFASNYLIWMLHGYSPEGWLLTNYFNRVQERQFRKHPEYDVLHLEVPLWLDIPPDMFGYPDNPRAISGNSPLSGSKSSTAYRDGLRKFERITADDYIDSFPTSGKAWLYPDGTLLPVDLHLELSGMGLDDLYDNDGILQDMPDAPFWYAAMDAGLVRIDISYENFTRGKPPHSIVADTGSRQLTASQINALRTILSKGGVPKMFLSVGGLDPSRNFRGNEHVYNTGVGNLGRFLSSTMTGLLDAPSSNVGKTNYPGSLAPFGSRSSTNSGSAKSDKDAVFMMEYNSIMLEMDDNIKEEQQKLASQIAKLQTKYRDENTSGLSKKKMQEEIDDLKDRADYEIYRFKRTARENAAILFLRTYNTDDDPLSVDMIADVIINERLYAYRASDIRRLLFDPDNRASSKKEARDDIKEARDDIANKVYKEILTRLDVKFRSGMPIDEIDTGFHLDHLAETTFAPMILGILGEHFEPFDAQGAFKYHLLYSQDKDDKPLSEKFVSKIRQLNPDDLRFVPLDAAIGENQMSDNPQTNFQIGLVYLQSLTSAYRAILRAGHPDLAPEPDSVVLNLMGRSPSAELQEMFINAMSGTMRSIENYYRQMDGDDLYTTPIERLFDLSYSIDPEKSIGMMQDILDSPRERIIDTLGSGLLDGYTKKQQRFRIISVLYELFDAGLSMDEVTQMSSLPASEIAKMIVGQRAFERLTQTIDAEKDLDDLNSILGNPFETDVEWWRKWESVGEEILDEIIKRDLFSLFVDYDNSDGPDFSIEHVISIIAPSQRYRKYSGVFAAFMALRKSGLSNRQIADLTNTYNPLINKIFDIIGVSNQDTSSPPDSRQQ